MNVWNRLFGRRRADDTSRSSPEPFTYVATYWDAAKASNTFWEERRANGQKLVLATFPWPPESSGPTAQNRHIVFVIDRREGTPIRSVSYEPEHSGSGVFVSEAFSDGSRVNHGKVSHMTREEFWSVALDKLFKSQASADSSAAGRQARDIHAAAIAGDIATIRALLRDNPKMVFEKKDGATALHAAASAGEKEVAAVLLENGADVNATNQAGMTPLSVANMSALLFFERQGKYDPVATLLRQRGGHE